MVRSAPQMDSFDTNLLFLYEKKFELIHQAYFSFSIDALLSHGKRNLCPLADKAIFVIVVQDAQDEDSKVINVRFRRVRVLYQPHILKE
jgi:hypothetical protein